MKDEELLPLKVMIDLKIAQTTQQLKLKLVKTERITKPRLSQIKTPR